MRGSISKHNYIDYDVPAFTFTPDRDLRFRLFLISLETKRCDVPTNP